MNNQLADLITKTTIYKVEDNKGTLICGEDKVTRFMVDQGTLVTIESLEPIWTKIFDSYGDTWNTERQLYRLLYDQTRLFITSFTFLRIHKVDFINSHSKDENSFRQFSNCLADMYIFGKKATDLIKTIDNSNNKDEFSERFSLTRNLIFEHNYAPNLLDGFIVEPSFFNSSGTDSGLEIRIHSETQEALYSAYTDYYEDYYNLEDILLTWLKEKAVQ